MTEKICSSEHCTELSMTKGLCSKHYDRSRNRSRAKRKPCVIEGCTTKARYDGKCRLHSDFLQYGDQADRYQARFWNIMTLYGVSKAQYDAQLVAQQNVCAVCREPFGPDFVKNTEQAVVDHCHKTGTFRGILHSRCNIAVGCLQDDLEKAYGVVWYLKSRIPT